MFIIHLFVHFTVFFINENSTFIVVGKINERCLSFFEHLICFTAMIQVSRACLNILECVNRIQDIETPCCASHMSFGSLLELSGTVNQDEQ